MAKRRKKSSEFTGLKDSIETVSIKLPRHHPQNPNKHDERNIQAIMKSIDEFKQLAPLVVWGSKNYVIVGNGRLEAAKRLNWEEIDIVRADHLTEEQALAYMIADNKTNALSEFDFQMVAKIMGRLADKQVDLSITGFAEFEVEPLMQAEWIPPTDTSMPNPGEEKEGTVRFQEDQWAIVAKALITFREFEGHESEKPAEALAIICQEWLEAVQ